VRPGDISDEEILAALRTAQRTTGRDRVPLAMTAGDVAHKVWTTRGTSTPTIADRHVKPKLAALVNKGEVASAVGYDVREIGRPFQTRRTATYYVLAEYARQHKAKRDKAAALLASARNLAAQFAASHDDRFHTVEGSPAGVTMTFTIGQATALLSKWNKGLH
jgi:hypothetical protein